MIATPNPTDRHQTFNPLPHPFQKASTIHKNHFINNLHTYKPATNSTPSQMPHSNNTNTSKQSSKNTNTPHTNTNANTY